MAKVDPIGRRKTNNQVFIIIWIIFTITEKQLNNVVVKKSHVASLGGNWKIKWSECPSIWLIFEPAVSPTPNTFRALSRLCKSPQLFFLKKKTFLNMNLKVILLTTYKKKS